MYVLSNKVSSFFYIVGTEQTPCNKGMPKEILCSCVTSCPKNFTWVKVIAKWLQSIAMLLRWSEVCAHEIMYFLNGFVTNHWMVMCFKKSFLANMHIEGEQHWLCVSKILTSLNCCTKLKHKDRVFSTGNWSCTWLNTKCLIFMWEVLSE